MLRDLTKTIGRTWRIPVGEPGSSVTTERSPTGRPTKRKQRSGAVAAADCNGTRGLTILGEQGYPRLRFFLLPNWGCGAPGEQASLGAPQGCKGFGPFKEVDQDKRREGGDLRVGFLPKMFR